MHLLWRLDGIRRIRRAGPRLLLATRHRIWREPTLADLSDLRFGPGGAEGVPQPPFQFVKEHFTGSQPCVAVRDARRPAVAREVGLRSQARVVRRPVRVGARLLRGGDALRRRAARSRRRSACSGRATASAPKASSATRASSSRIRRSACYFDEHSWAWDDNPFLGTPQLSGLKIVNMLLSNWDTKDRRDVSRGSNTAIFEHRVSRWGREARYLITDWGGAMGKWGSNVVSRGRWDVERVRGADAGVRHRRHATDS